MKSAFITGGNSGLGLEVVKFLASTSDVGKIFFTYRSKGSRDFNNHPSGIYYEGIRPIKSSALSYNETKQAELWRFSKELIKENTSHECYVCKQEK